MNNDIEYFYVVFSNHMLKLSSQALLKKSYSDTYVIGKERLGLVAHSLIPTTQEAEAGGYVTLRPT